MIGEAPARHVSKALKQPLAGGLRGPRPVRILGNGPEKFGERVLFAVDRPGGGRRADRNRALSVGVEADCVKP